MNTKEEIIDWLRDAYAMERGLEITLQKQADNEKLLPSARQQAMLHRSETERHAEAVKACLESLGADTSTLKTGLAQGMEMAKGMATAFARDEQVKDILAAYAMEYFEIACYKALRVGGETLGLTSVVAMCDSIIPDEERMAKWLDANLPDLIRSYLTNVAVS